MTVKQLLQKADFDAVWYHLSLRHNVQNKPIQGERLRQAYREALDEMLLLVPIAGEKFVVRCKLIEDTLAGTPDLFYSVDGINEVGEEYGLDFTPWLEWLAFDVSDESVEAYGINVVTAEVLWEMTFNGYTSKTIEEATEKLDESVKEADEAVQAGRTTPFNLDEFRAKNEADIAESNKLANELLEAPFSREFKDMVTDMIVAGFTDYERDLSPDDVLAVLMLRVAESKFEVKSNRQSLAMDLLHRILENIDYDEQSLLLEWCLGGK